MFSKREHAERLADQDHPRIVAAIHLILTAKGVHTSPASQNRVM
jgi:hypothetical protein